MMRLRLLFVLIAACIQHTSLLRASEHTVGFNRDIRAILTDKCFACHGPDAETVEGGLRLDLPDVATDASLGAIVPGHPEQSEVVRRIHSEDEYEVMPPPETNKTLTAKEKQLLETWIAEGAVYEPHWAFTPLQSTLRDAVGGHRVDLTAAIDHAIDERLAEQSLQPAPPADKVTLIRRLSFDLTGLPPTLEEVQQFIEDESDDAYARLVDRLLESPRYGERMAVYWLDLVRYADTVGYHGDQNVSQSPYRDYVIDSFNENLPYDQFIKEQLAGDLLPNASLTQQVASGYNRLNQTTEEGGSQAKEYLAIYFADRVRNVSQVFMGATMGCAQCHDHKFDPYTMRDFYSLGAFFADLEERGVYSARSRPPMIPVPDDQQQTRLDELQSQITELQSQIPRLRATLLDGFAEWEAQALQEAEQSKSVEHGWIDDQQLIGGSRSGDWKFVGKNKAPVHSGTQSRRQSGKGTVQHFFIDADSPYQVSAEANATFFAWVYLDPKNPPTSIMLQFNDGNWEHRKIWGSDEIDFGRRKESHPGYRRAGELPETGRWIRLEATPEEVGLKPGSKVNGMAFTQFGGLAYWDKAGVVDRYSMPAELVDALHLPDEQRSTRQRELLRDYYLENADEMIALRNRIEEKTTERQSIDDSATQTVVSKSTEPRTIRILPRGNWMDDSGEIVEPAIPEFLGELAIEGRATRLDLANWLCNEDNPLPSRTMVNRLWALLFGRGICTSVDDLGGQGTFPSYPELLDELAIEFIQSGWDIKHILRSIVMSDAYQRSSNPPAELLAADPYNDLFGRQARFCVNAEFVRDTALSISGLLVEEIGGPSVRPYQPAGYYAQLNFPRRKYVADEGESQYRRGLYTHWQRTFLHPMLKAFDAPSREECTASRSRSNTPLQALVLLNDPSFLEAARVFAERIVREGGESPQEKIRWAYTTAVSREPSSVIQDTLQQVYAKHLHDYQVDPQAASALLQHGQAPIDSELVANEQDKAELAAWTSVARVLLNLHETITRY
jgi:hypothetical protein